MRQGGHGGQSSFSEGFKRNAVAQITKRGYPVAEVSQRLGVSQHSLHAWKQKFSQSPGEDRDATTATARTVESVKG
ncbi:MAG: transposase [Anderseniella sp.]|nr:transposase [Anderseniella sp.]